MPNDVLLPQRSAHDASPADLHRDRRRRHRRLVALAAALAFAGTTMAACGGGADPVPLGDRPPATDASVDLASVFDHIRLPDDATPVTDHTTADGAVTRSFGAAGEDPTQVVDFFATSLPDEGWHVVDPPASTGTDSVAGAWTRDGHHLEVSALASPGLEGAATQFDLVLLPTLDSSAPFHAG